MSEANPQPPNSAQPAEPPKPPPGIEEQLKDVHAAAVELRNFTITFLTLLVYVGLIIASTSHEQILRIAPVKLPLLDVEVPLLRFYQVMPALLFFMNLYILVQHYLFSQQVFLFDTTLQRELAEQPEQQEEIRRKLGNLPFLHWLVGRHSGLMYLLMALISVGCLIVWPQGTLLWLQMAFLPYHDQDIVEWQRWWLTADSLMLAYLWAKTLDRRDSSWRWWLGVGRFANGAWGYLRLEAEIQWRRSKLCRQAVLSSGLPWHRRLGAGLAAWRKDVLQAWQFGDDRRARRRGRCAEIWQGAGRCAFALLLLAVLLDSWWVSVLPDSPEEETLRAFFQDKEPAWWKKGVVTALETIGLCRLSEQNLPPRPCLTNVNQPYREPRWVFSPAARLHEIREEKLKEQEKLEYDPERTSACPQALDKTSPDEKCYLVDGWLPRNLILREKVLTENKLEPEMEAALQTEKLGIRKPITAAKPDILNKVAGLNLRHRHLEYADFSQSSLPKADLRQANLKFATLENSRLEQARMRETRLPGAILNSAQLSNADLSEAKLPDAYLLSAQLPGAYLLSAQLHRANLREAELPGADLRDAQLPGANLRKTQLSGANLRRTQLPGANLYKARLPGADLSLAQLPSADLSGAQLPGVDLSGAQLPGVDLNGAQLPGVILTDIVLQEYNLSKREGTIASFHQALQNLPAFQGEDGKKTLAGKEAQFANRINQAASLAINKPSLAVAPCLSEKAELQQAGCTTPKSGIQQAAAYWTDMACRDDTANQAIAKQMIKRSEQPIFRKGESVLIYSELAALLHKALSDAETAEKNHAPQPCPGLAALPEEWKKKLRAKP